MTTYIFNKVWSSFILSYIILEVVTAYGVRGIQFCMKDMDCLGANRVCSHLERKRKLVGRCVCMEGYIPETNSVACINDSKGLETKINTSRVQCEKDDDCDINEVCMSWNYDPDHQLARKLNDLWRGNMAGKDNKHQICIDTWIIQNIYNNHLDGLDPDAPRTGGGLRTGYGPRMADNYKEDEYYFSGRSPPRVHQQYIGFAEDMMLILFLFCILATLVTVHRANCYRQFQEARRNSPLRHILPLPEDRPPPYTNNDPDSVDGPTGVVCSTPGPKLSSDAPPPSYEEALFRNEVNDNQDISINIDSTNQISDNNIVSSNINNISVSTDSSVNTTTVINTEELTTTVPLTIRGPLTTTDTLTATDPLTTTDSLTATDPLTTTDQLTSTDPLTATDPLTTTVPMTTTAPLTIAVPLKTTVSLTKTAPLKTTVPLKTIVPTIANIMSPKDTNEETTSSFPSNESNNRELNLDLTTTSILTSREIMSGSKENSIELETNEESLETNLEINVDNSPISGGKIETTENLTTIENNIHLKINEAENDTKETPIVTTEDENQRYPTSLDQLLPNQQGDAKDEQCEEESHLDQLGDAKYEQDKEYQGESPLTATDQLLPNRQKDAKDEQCEEGSNLDQFGNAKYQQDKEYQEESPLTATDQLLPNHHKDAKDDQDLIGHDSNQTFPTSLDQLLPNHQRDAKDQQDDNFQEDSPLTSTNHVSVINSNATSV